MLQTRIKRIGRIGVTAVTVVLLAALLLSLDSVRTSVEAASLKHIDEIVAARGTFNILEIVPDTAAASFGYYIDGQEPVSGWKTTVAGKTSPAVRSEYVNTLFGRLASKNIMGNGTTTPLKYTYYDANSATNKYYTEAYTVTDPQNWSKLHLNASESATLTGTMTPAANGAYRANYTYMVQNGGGYVQNIDHFVYTAAPAYGQGTYYYAPVFTQIQIGQDLSAILNDTVYTKDDATGIYSTAKTVQDMLNAGGFFKTGDTTVYYYADPAQPGVYTQVTQGMDFSGILNDIVYTKDAVTGNYTTAKTIQDMLNAGGFDVTKKYYYVDPTQTGAPGNFNYAAVVNRNDADEAPGDGFVTPASGNSYFSRSISSYSYVVTGGNNDFSNTGNTVYTINYTDVYYKAGFVNNNLLKTLVFGLDSSNMNNINVTVTVRKASDITPSDISGAGMIYISSGTDITQDGVTTAYSAANDIPDARAVDIYNYAANQNPVIIDFPIIQGVSLAPPAPTNNIQKLCLLCLQSTFSVTTQTSLSGLTIGALALSSDTDKTFVNNNVYCFNPFNDQTLGGQPNISSLVSSLWGDPFSSGVYSDGFSAVLATIQNENFLKQIAGQQDLLPENVTLANAVRHIINYKGQRQTNAKTSIKVLDLEPAKVSATALTKAAVEGWVNNTLTESQITIVTMTTGEFVGKIEDINETYDMIYIGASTESFTTGNYTVTVNGQPITLNGTLHNDANMNGLIYSNIGDKYNATIEMAGIRSQDYMTVNGVKGINGTNGSNANVFRFSGDDITKTAVTEIQKFAQAGYPIILADGLFDADQNSPTYKRLDARVDNSSYMYQAITSVFGTTSDAASVCANVMTQTNAGTHTDTVIKYINVSKPSIELTSWPVDYVNLDGPTQVADSDGYYNLDYIFTIHNVTDPTPLSTTYDCRLFIDVNADGRFADTEQLGDIAIHTVTGDGKDGPLVLPLSDGPNHQYYALSADVKYHATRQMNDAGIIPWKLEVVKNGADQIHASKLGFTRLAAGSDAQTINILQIMQAGTSGTNLNLSQQLNPDPSGSNQQLKGTDGIYYTGIYGKLIRDVKDFHINITEMDTDILEGQSDVLGTLNQYDMLIIGFNDCYNGIGPKSAAAINDYINTEKRSVLFTHDTTSLSQVPASNYPMFINGTPTTKTLTGTEVIYNSAAYLYQSVDNHIHWYGDYASACPPNVQQKPSTYVVLMTSDKTSANETDYWDAKAGTSGNFQIYSMNGCIQDTTVTSTTTLADFKALHSSSDIIYVYCSSANGWYGVSDTTKYNLTSTDNFTKFVSGTRYTCTGLTYYYHNGNSSHITTSSYTTTSYAQIMRNIYNVNPNSYSVDGTYTASNNTYTIGANTWYPATGAPFLQSTLYDMDPANSYTQSTIPNNISDWGYYFNTVIRDTVGLDRYGVTYSLLKSIVDVSSSMPPQDINTVLQNNRSVAFTPKSARASTVPEFQGYTNYALIRFPVSGNSYKYTNNTYLDRETTNVSQINKGQITTYPYPVNTASFGGTDSSITSYGGSYMKIGNTHEQYFQINMNTDDIVVWYCLSNYSSYNADTGVITYDDSSYYDDVPNDCVNAYYIYNKDNVTYSGVGHTAAAHYYTTDNPISQEYINEAKLFVNTMIAAYKSKTKAPSVKIKSDAAGTIDTKQKFTVVDESNGTVLGEHFGATDDSRAVYFRIYDPNFDSTSQDDNANAKFSVSFYVSDPIHGTVNNDLTNAPTSDAPVVCQIPGTVFYNNVSTAFNIYNLDENNSIADPAKLMGSHVYRINLPDYFMTPDGAKIPVLDQLATSGVYSLTIYVQIVETGFSPQDDYIEIKKQQLFPLA